MTELVDGAWKPTHCSRWLSEPNVPNSVPAKAELTKGILDKLTLAGQLLGVHHATGQDGEKDGPEPHADDVDHVTHGFSTLG